MGLIRSRLFIHLPAHTFLQPLKIHLKCLFKKILAVSLTRSGFCPQFLSKLNKTRNFEGEGEGTPSLPHAVACWGIQLKSTSRCTRQEWLVHGPRQMSMRICSGVFILLLAATSAPARESTDVIVMKNGDHLTGEIKGLNQGVLYISMSYILGTSQVQWSKVDHIESKQLFLVKTEDGNVYTGTLSTANAEKGRPMTIEVVESSSKQVQIERPKIVQMDTTSESFWQRFNGTINSGITYTKGNQSTQYNL